MKPWFLACTAALALSACSQAETVEADLKAAVAKEFGVREELIYFVPAKGADKKALCGMAGRPATAAEPFLRPKPFLYRDGKFSRFDREEAERTVFLAACEDKVPILVPEL